MNPPTPQIQKLAARLVAYESDGDKSIGLKTLPAPQVFEKLRPRLATLMGNGGFRALVIRAHALAKLEIPWLRPVHVAADGTLENLETVAEKLQPKQFAEGKNRLLAEMLGLLIAFIGPSLTLALVRDVWPKVSVNDSGFSHSEQSEHRNRHEISH